MGSRSRRGEAPQSTRAALTPNFSRDGKSIVYTSATTSLDGCIGDDSETDVHVVPFGDRKGGPVAPVAGAATPGVSEYYPSFSADDALIAFNRAPSTSGKIYYRPDAEIYVVPAGGGTPTRLAANDPPACTGESSPGVINSWAKWSPSAVSAGGRRGVKARARLSLTREPASIHFRPFLGSPKSPNGSSRSRTASLKPTCMARCWKA